MKKEISLNKANRLINHGPVLLISTLYNKKPNIFTVAWNMPVSHSPMTIAIACGERNLSTEAIKKTKEFIINIPDENIKEAVIRCGKTSGRNTDKFKNFNFTKLESHKLSVYGIGECIGHLECRVNNEIKHSDHIIFISDVLYACVDDNKWNFEENIWITEKTRTLHHLGGDHFAVSK